MSTLDVDGVGVMPVGSLARVWLFLWWVVVNGDDGDGQRLLDCRSRAVDLVTVNVVLVDVVVDGTTVDGG